MQNKMSEDKKIDLLIEYGIATEKEIQLVLGICPSDNEELLNDILFYREGYRDFETWLEDISNC